METGKSWNFGGVTVWKPCLELASYTFVHHLGQFSSMSCRSCASICHCYCICYDYLTLLHNVVLWTAVLHKKYHSNDPDIYKCKLCHYTARDQQLLDEHYQFRHDPNRPKPHICYMCGKRFHTSVQLEKHLISMYCCCYWLLPQSRRLCFDLVCWFVSWHDSETQ